MYILLGIHYVSNKKKDDITFNKTYNVNIKIQMNESH